MSNYYFEIKFVTPDEKVIDESGFYCAETLRRATNDLYNYFGVNEQNEENVLIQFFIAPLGEGPIIMTCSRRSLYDIERMDVGKVGY